MVEFQEGVFGGGGVGGCGLELVEARGDEFVGFVVGPTSGGVAAFAEVGLVEVGEG